MKKNLLKKIVSVGTVFSVLVSCVAFADLAFATDGNVTGETPVTASAAPADNTEKAFLEDGEYTVNTALIKTDRKTPSMAADSIINPVKLVVKDGIVKATMSFNPIDKPPFKGYLGNLDAFNTGFIVSERGDITGESTPATIDEYHTNQDGSRVSDAYGTNYPKTVTFQVAKEAFVDGYMPVKVLIPVMEAISPGNGTQKVYIKFDWNTVAKKQDAVDNEVVNNIDKNKNEAASMDNDDNKVEVAKVENKEAKAHETMKETKTPKTGDETDLLSLASAMALAAGLAYSLRKRVK